MTSIEAGRGFLNFPKKYQTVIKNYKVFMNKILKLKY